MRIALVYHPRMARARLVKVALLARVLQARGHITSHHDSMAFDAPRDAPRADLVCVCGGDGTAQLVIAQQADPAALPPLAIYPTGTINLLARELGYPADPVQFAARLEQAGAALPVPLAAINGRAFLCCSSVGADAHAVAALSEDLKARIGRLAYVAAMARVLLRWRRHPIEVEHDAGSFTAEAIFILRGRFYAGPWTLDHAASLAEDHMRVVALPTARRRDVARLALHALLGGKRPAAHWHLVATRRLSLRGTEAVAVQIDGDHAGTTPLDIAMTGQAVRFA
jgi:diacylglycerol kinase (ATP)